MLSHYIFTKHIDFVNTSLFGTLAIAVMQGKS